MEIPVTDTSTAHEAHGLRQVPATSSEVAGFWWLWLLVGVAWIIAALVILQFDQASVTTVGIIVGLMFAAVSAQQFVLMFVADELRWLWGIFGVFFAAAAVICFIN
ncbi:MAG: hypothetical protein ACXVFN_10790, partial [Solirubrobacteraceae bacterium]